MPDIYINIASQTGLNQCVIDADGGTVWMYLHDLTERCVIGDAPLCSIVPLIFLADFKKQYQRGKTPPLVKEYSTTRALIVDISIDRIDVRWSKDGRSVVAFVDEEPFSMIIVGQKQGFSKATSMKGPWGNPWCDETFNRIFDEQGH